MPTTPSHARCLKCNYPLHSLPTHICPECGKEFNPADAATMNLGRIPGPIARWLLRRAGWPTLLLAVAATITLLITSGPPRMVAPKLADTAYLLNFSQRSNRLNTKLDVFYADAIVVWIVLLAFLAIRIVARVAAQRIYSRRDPAPRRHAFRQILLLLVVLLSAAIMLYAWPMRVTRVWMTAKPKPTPYGLAVQLYGPPIRRLYLEPCPLNLSDSEKLAALRLAIQSHLQLHRDRMRAIEFFIAQYPKEALDTLHMMVATDSDPDIRALAVHIVSVTNNPENAAEFERLLNDPATAVRAAAADAIDILRGPGITQPEELWTARPPEVLTDPPINVAAFVPVGKSDSSSPLPRVSFDAAVRQRLEQMMTGGETSEEREAAARALVNWPPVNYKLRVAEWGVWIVDGKGNVDLEQKVIDEIPPFVHRIGNTHDSLGDRFPQWMGHVTKPIVHVTADRPLALDIEAYLYLGRPWFAYPMPDDLVLSRRLHFPIQSDEVTVKSRKQMDNLAFPPLADLREGYPWLGPPHRYHFRDPRFKSGYANFISMGVRWQSLIVLPTQASWMKPPAVPNDAKFKWWTDLRSVPSSYLANRGESERFLYYDGPTQSKPPVVVSLKDSRLHLSAPPHRPQATEAPHVLPDEGTPLEQDHTPLRDVREGFFIRVKDGTMSAMRFALSGSDQPSTQNVPAALPISSDQTIAAFKKLLMDYGLTAEESDGLIEAWRALLFQTDGQRILLRMSADDYDALCPMGIRPPPTTLIRLGFILTEF